MPIIKQSKSGNVKSTVDRLRSSDCKESVDKARATLLLLLIVMEIPVTIYTQNSRLILDLFDESKTGKDAQLADGLSVRHGRIKLREMVGIGEEIQIIISVAGTIATSVAANLITIWLLKKLDKEEAKLTKLEIDRVTVELDEDKIKKIITEKIRKTS